MTLPLRLSVAVLGLLALPSGAQSTLHDVSGSVGDSFGQCCDLVGDVNGDGKGEFLVGAWRDDNGALTDAGSVFLYSGADGSLLATIQGGAMDDHMGFGSSAAGDLNGDGFADICAAADEDNIAGVGANAGSATIMSGFDGSVLYALTGVASGDLFGWSTAAVGDVNGDGRDDVLVSALNAEDLSSPNNAGSLTVFSGLDGSILQRVFGDAVGGQLGSNVGPAGDVDNDGKNDFAGVQGSLVRVFSGADGSELKRRGGGGGTIVCSGGIDGNGDGFDDYLIGSAGVSSNTGRVQLISGFDNSVLHEVFGVATGDQLGASVVGAGDLDGDGYGDFAAGMPGFDGAAGANTGAVRAFSGRTGALLFAVEGDLANDRLGSDVGGGRDVNGDGITDVVASSVSTAKAKVMSFVPRGLEPFGTGSAGCAGTLTLLAGGVPTLGNAAFELHVSNAGGPTHLLIGDSEDTAGSLLFGALFHLDPTPAPPALGLVARASLPAADAHGSLVAPFPVPNNAALLGQPFVFQAVSFFPLGACSTRIATTRGLRVTIQ
ncbi:MAG: VCBS repeat-containing protein [Planctomycetes bacterium]|nr:VCBS repeat-containing protein [Planctomycetota bacterium]